jgi:hypothetical protein
MQVLMLKMEVTLIHGVAWLMLEDSTFILAGSRLTFVKLFNNIYRFKVHQLVLLNGNFKINHKSDCNGNV